MLITVLSLKKIMLKLTKLIILIFFISCTNNSDSVSYYFDSGNGSDLNEGNTIDKPFKTLKKNKRN